MERIEDKSKALSYIGIEVADALKLIPAPQEDAEEIVEEHVQAKPVQEIKEVKENKKAEKSQILETPAQDTYYEETRVEVKPSLWQRFKQSKFVRTIKYIMKIRVVLEVPALPSGKEENL